MIDEKFQSSEEKRLVRFKKKEKERKSKEEEHLKTNKKKFQLELANYLIRKGFLKMNEIVSNDYKENLLKDNYKLIYPNNLGLILTMKNKEGKKVIDRISYDNVNISLIRFLKNRKNLFLFCRVYDLLEIISKIPLNLEFRDSESPGYQYAPITKIKLLDEKGEEYLGRRWTKRIKELYLNVSKESLVIVIDESFQWPEEKKEQLKEKTKKENSERLENKINSLLK